MTAPPTIFSTPKTSPKKMIPEVTLVMMIRYWCGRLALPPPQEFRILASMAPIYDPEESRGLGSLYHHHVVLGVVYLHGYAQVVPGLVFVCHLQRDLHRGLLLAVPVSAQLQGGVGIEAPGTEVTWTAQTLEDGPDVSHTVFVPQHDWHPYRVADDVGFRFPLFGGQLAPLGSVSGPPRKALTYSLI